MELMRADNGQQVPTLAETGGTLPGWGSRPEIRCPPARARCGRGPGCGLPARRVARAPTCHGDGDGAGRATRTAS